MVAERQNNWHPLMHAEHLRRPNSGYEHSEVVSQVFQQQQQQCERPHSGQPCTADTL